MTGKQHGKRTPCFESLDSRILLSANSNIAPIADVNSVNQVENVVTVEGSDADNIIQLDLDSTTHVLTIDGETHEFDASIVDRILIYANEGVDTVTINGSLADDRVESNVRSTEILSTDYIARVETAEDVTVDTGGGTDRVKLIDGVGDDRVELRPESLVYAGAGGRAIEVTNHERAEAFASLGGIDEVLFYDSTQDDLFVAKYLRSFIAGDGFLNFARGFEFVEAIREAGGNDEARLFDSPADDQLSATATETKYKVEFATHTVRDFPVTRSYSSAGHDTADVVGHHFITDIFVWEPHSAFMHTSGAYDPDTAASLFADEEAVTATNFMIGFSEIEANGSDPSDRAELRGSEENDTYVGLPDKVELISPTSQVEANFFRVTRAFGRGGVDTAHLEDSKDNDRYVGNATFSYLEGLSFLNYVSGFQIDAISRNGGTDTAQVSGYTGPGVDYLVHSGDEFMVVGPERSERVVGFAEAVGTGDSAGLVVLNAITIPFQLSGTHSQADEPTADFLSEILMRQAEPIDTFEIADGDIELLGGSSRRDR